MVGDLVGRAEGEERRGQAKTIPIVTGALPRFLLPPTLDRSFCFRAEATASINCNLVNSNEQPCRRARNAHGRRVALEKDTQPLSHAECRAQRV